VVLVVGKVALLLDGGFVRKKLQNQGSRIPDVDQVMGLCSRILQKPRLEDCQLFRIFYYDAPPLDGTATNPIDKSEINFSQSKTARANQALLDKLELQPDLAVRRGTLVQKGWKLGSAALKDFESGPRILQATDLVPDISQKGVDIKIGLDIAWISLKRVADILVLVTGDSDFVPPMKFARKEGLKVYLECLGHGVRRELKAHADFVL
jgi:uncharacterized LabA/DUF88 family protein